MHGLCKGRNRGEGHRYSSSNCTWNMRYMHVHAWLIRSLTMLMMRVVAFGFSFPVWTIVTAFTAVFGAVLLSGPDSTDKVCSTNSQPIICTHRSGLVLFGHCSRQACVLRMDVALDQVNSVCLAVAIGAYVFLLKVAAGSVLASNLMR